MWDNNIIIIITSILGATLTFYVSESLKQGAVKASALLALIVGLFFYIFPELLNAYLTKNIPVVFIGASFIGMAAPKNHNNYRLLVIASILFSIVYINKSSFFNGYGGALGTLAFIALISALVLNYAFVSTSPFLKKILSIRKNVFKSKK